MLSAADVRRVRVVGMGRLGQDHEFGHGHGVALFDHVEDGKNGIVDQRVFGFPEHGADGFHALADLGRKLNR